MSASTQSVAKNQEMIPGKLGSLWRLALMLLSIVALGYLLVLPLDWTQQLFVSVCLILAAFALDRAFQNQATTLTLAGISIFCSARYIYYRLSNTFGIGAESGPQPRTIDMTFMLILLAAELYAFLVLVLGYFQTILPLGRKPEPLSGDPAEWPTIDVFIPTYNEPLTVVRYTVWAAMNLDWPADRYRVHILDDGRREDFRKFAAEVGCAYITRTDNAHAKAGNINRALAKTKAEFVAIFDCDHVPTRSFLQMTLGWFLKDQRLAMLQTPHHFYSPDPFERNLKQFRKIPNEGELFYGLVQDGNDLWNATFFCGSCAVLRRTALEEIGGIAVETVTEDAHTSLRMQIRGWNTAYINIPQAAGLATESLSSHIGQRIRWARGMIQILRLDNPLTRTGLRLPQRFCYFNAMTHFLYAVPRLIFLTSPLIYLLFGHLNIRGYSLTILAYALPHIFLSNLSNSRIQGKFRYSFWNEVYEAVLAPYILLPTVLALVNPRLGKFNVTAKGGLVPKSYFDRRIARPYMVLLLLNFAGLVVGISRLLWWDSAHPGTLVMNAVWTLYNIIILGAACAVAYETQQNRSHVRVMVQMPVVMRFSDGQTLQGETIDLSNSGVAVRVPRGLDLDSGDPLFIRFATRSTQSELPAKVIGNDVGRLRLQFAELNLAEEEELTRVLYSRADSWLGWNEQRERDRPLHSLWLITRLSMKGIGAMFRNLGRAVERPEPEQAKAEPAPAKKAAAAGAMLLIVALLFSAKPALARSSNRQKTDQQTSGQEKTSRAPENVDTFHVVWDFASLSHSKEIVLRGRHATATLGFSVSSSQVVSGAVLHLRYRLAAELQEGSTLLVAVNGIGERPIPLARSRDGKSVELLLTIPADLLLIENSLELQLSGTCSSDCDPAALVTTIESDSTIELSGQRLRLASDLNLLPAPFFDPGMQNGVVSFALLSTPTAKELQAAGVVAGWIGSAADSRGVRFSATIGRITAENTVVIACASDLPTNLNFSQIEEPTIAIRPNPIDSFSKVLIITGRDEDQVLQAAIGLALNTEKISGDTLTFKQFKMPTSRRPDDAPRWIPSARPATFGDVFSSEQLRVKGFEAQTLYFRLPPDLYYGNRGSIRMQLNFRADGLSQEQKTGLKVSLNNVAVAHISVSADSTLIQHATLVLPISALHSFGNTLTLDWTRDGSSASNREAQLQVMRSSTIDIHDIPHFTNLPRLELFAEAGYPYTRFADLSQTAFVLANDRSNEQIGLFLNLMAYLSGRTGYPGLKVTVASPEELRSLSGKDLIVLGDYSDQSLVEALQPKLQFRLVQNIPRLTGSESWWMDLRRAAWNVKGRTRQSIEDLLEADPGSQGVIAGIESPFGEGRSLVAILGHDASSTDLLGSQLVGIRRSGAIYGSISVLYNGRFESLYLTRDEYHVGVLPRYQASNRWFIRRTYLLPPLIVALVFLLTLWLQPRLRQQARMRLEGRS